MKSERENVKACPEFADRLVDLSDGELAGDERHSIESHVARCAGCRAELARLDASLAMLHRTDYQPVQPTDKTTSGLRPIVYCSAALSLVLLLATGFTAISFFAKQKSRQTARVEPSPITPRVAPIVQANALDEAAILRQIALIEQQARIQASLDLLPRDPWFAEQRAANEELLVRFKAAVSRGETFSQEELPESDGNLDEGDTL